MNFDKEQMREMISDNLCVSFDACKDNVMLKDLEGDSLSLLSLFVEMSDFVNKEVETPENVMEMTVRELLEYINEYY